MSNKWGVKPEQAKILLELERMIGESIPLVDELKWNTIGVKIKKDSIIGLSIYGCELISIPESIGNLNSLQELDLTKNQLTTLPESIGNLQSLQNLGLANNQVNTLPESIGNLQSLRNLNLYNNLLNTLPESIANLISLRVLDITFNNFSTLPQSIWRLNNLETIDLNFNPWEGEWKELEKLAKGDVKYLFDFLKKKATINIFISHTVNEFNKYRVKELAEYLEQQLEIDQVYFCEEDLKGNLDIWMEKTVLKSHLLLFIGTQQSIFNSQDCWNELFLARKHNIEVIPIKGVDASWKDLIKVGLSREFGFEFDKDKFDELCENIHIYICEFKRERDLVSFAPSSHSLAPKPRLTWAQIEKNIYINSIISTIKDNLLTLYEVFSKISLEKFEEIKLLEGELEAKKITFIEFLQELINTSKRS